MYYVEEVHVDIEPTTAFHYVPNILHLFCLVLFFRLFVFLPFYLFYPLFIFLTLFHILSSSVISFTNIHLFCVSHLLHLSFILPILSLQTTPCHTTPCHVMSYNFMLQMILMLSPADQETSESSKRFQASAETYTVSAPHCTASYHTSFQSFFISFLCSFFEYILVRPLHYTAYHSYSYSYSILSIFL